MSSVAPVASATNATLRPSLASTDHTQSTGRQLKRALKVDLGIERREAESERTLTIELTIPAKRFGADFSTDFARRILSVS